MPAKKTRRTVAKGSGRSKRTSRPKRKGVSKQQVKSFARAIQQLVKPQGVLDDEGTKDKSPKRRAGL